MIASRFVIAATLTGSALALIFLPAQHMMLSTAWPAQHIVPSTGYTARAFIAGELALDSGMWAGRLPMRIC